MQSNWQIECWELLYLKNCFSPAESTACCIFIILSMSRLPRVLPCPKKRKLAGDQRLPTRDDDVSGLNLAEREQEEEEEAQQVPCSLSDLPRLPCRTRCCPRGSGRRTRLPRKPRAPSTGRGCWHTWRSRPWSTRTGRTMCLSPGKRKVTPPLPFILVKPPKWMRQSCREPSLICSFNSQQFQMAAAVQGQEASC